MGLRIRAYSGLQPVRRLAPEEHADELTDGIAFVIHPRFPGHAHGLDAATVYAAGARFEFCVGSYSGHVRWLEQLARLIGMESLDLFWQSPSDAPFAHLLDFADGNATMGAAHCARLSQDFAKWAERAAWHRDRDFRQLYVLWRHAFDMGARDGCVAFSTTESHARMLPAEAQMQPAYR